MVVMVSSFRMSVDDWLGKVLPADLYGRAPSTLEGGLDPQAQKAIAAVPGVARVQFLRTVDIVLDPARAPVALIARSFDGRSIGEQLPLAGALAQPAPGSGATPVYVSEAMVSLYGFEPGSTWRIPLGGDSREVFVAGVWRDYARQGGAIAMDLADYRALTGDATVSDVSVWLGQGASAATVGESILGAAPALAGAGLRGAGEIRALSLRIFDRSFAVTYVLEAIAIVVGLFGVASTYAAEALNRAREFGMMRHLGVSRRMVMGQLALEATIGTSIALLWGGLLGLLIALILTERVNPQSFHWTMDLALPLHILVPTALALLATAAVTTVVAARTASAGGPLQAVRQDW
jgi:putative ABC transport system permease protein